MSSTTEDNQSCNKTNTEIKITKFIYNYCYYYYFYLKSVTCCSGWCVRCIIVFLFYLKTHFKILRQKFNIYHKSNTVPPMLIYFIELRDNTSICQPNSEILSYYFSILILSQFAC